PMNSVLVEHYRLPERWLNVAAACEVLQRTNNPPLSNIPYPTAHCRIAADDLSLSGASFNGSNNPEHIIYNLRHEQYATDDAPSILQSVMATLYYLARPALALTLRKHIQRAL